MFETHQGWGGDGGEEGRKTVVSPPSPVWYNCIQSEGHLSLPVNRCFLYYFTDAFCIVHVLLHILGNVLDFFLARTMSSRSLCYLPGILTVTRLQKITAPKNILALALAQALFRQQQGEQAVPEVGTVFKYPLGSAQAPQLTDITCAGKQTPKMFWAV